MRQINLLFKKDRIEKSSELKNKKDLLGVFTSLLITGIIYAVFIYVFTNFAKVYIDTDFGNIDNQISRVKELLIIGFSLIFIVNVVIGVKKIKAVLTRGKEDDILIYQPINTGIVFIYKLLKIYLSQLLSTIFMILPMSIVVDKLFVLTGGVLYYFLLLVIVFLLPLMSCAIATLLSIPYIAISKRIQSQFVLKIVLYSIIVAAGFYAYGIFLNVLSDLIRSGNIRYIFDLKTVNLINETCAHLYPSNFFVNILLNDNVFINMLIVVGCSLVAVAISYFIIKKMYLNIMQDQLEGESSLYRKKIKLKKHSPLMSLVIKEFNVVLRTPTYAFQYFAMSISLPLMVYMCSFLLESMLSTLTFINCNYALAIFVVSMFSILTNTFCTTNISRDGKMFGILKTLPLSIKQIVNAKVLFCSIVSFASVFVSSYVLFATGFLNFAYFVITFVIGFIFSLVQIAYATRKDMKNPYFPNNDKEEVIEGNANMSTLIFVSLIITVLIGGGAVLLSIVLSMKYNEKIASLTSISFMFVITLIALILSTTYLYKGIDKEYSLEEF